MATKMRKLPSLKKSRVTKKTDSTAAESGGKHFSMRITKHEKDLLDSIVKEILKKEYFKVTKASAVRAMLYMVAEDNMTDELIAIMRQRL